MLVLQIKENANLEPDYITFSVQIRYRMFLIYVQTTSFSENHHYETTRFSFSLIYLSQKPTCLFVMHPNQGKKACKLHSVANGFINFNSIWFYHVISIPSLPLINTAKIGKTWMFILHTRFFYFLFVHLPEDFV